MKLPHLPKGAWLLAILAGALALRVAALGAADLWTDEIQTLHAVSLPWGEMLRERAAAGHVPLYFAIEKAWCSVFGTSQAALRLPSALLGVALLLPARTLFRRLAGERAAWAGAALLAVHPLFVELSREARMYPLLGLAAFVVADRAAAALDGESPGVLFWVAAVLGPFVHPTWGVAMVPLAAWLAFEKRSAAPGTRRETTAALVGLAASLALLAVALCLATPQHQELTRRPWPREAGVFLLRMFAGSDLTSLRDLLPRILFAVAWAAALAGGWRLATSRARRFAACVGAGVPVVCVAAGLLGGVPWGPARYVGFAAVGFVLLAAVAARPSLPAAAPLFLVCLWLALGPVLGPRTAWSDAAERVRGVPLPVVVDDASSKILLSHYLGREVFVGTPPPGAPVWRQARLVADDGTPRVRIVEERAPR